MPRNYGLKLINPKLRLIITIVATSSFAFIKSIEVGIIAFLGSIIILILGNRLVLRKVFFYVLVINTVYMIFGNWLFSPHNSNTVDIALFRINNEGLINGVIGALKRNAMIIFSFAWLSSNDSFYDILRAVSFFKKFNKTITIFLKWIQNLRYDFTLLYYSLDLRGFELKSKNFKKKTTQLYIILKAILNNFFNNIGKMTFSGESHFNFSDGLEEFSGEIMLSNLSIQYNLQQELVLENLNLTISEGQVVLVTGKNLSGKTTLLKAISGYIPKIEGYVINGDILVSNYKLNSEVPLCKINQFVRYIVENPVDSAIGLNVEQELFSQSNNINKIKHYSEIFKIRHLWGRDINTLSGGEQARVVLASLLCSEAKVLVLESPLGQLDHLGRQSFIKALSKLIESNSITVILSDQYLNYFEGLIERIIFLDNGKITLDKTLISNSIKDLLSKYDFNYPDNLKQFISHTNDSEIVASLSNVILSYDKKKVLNNISLNLYKNQCIAIQGDNGSGKSTLALALSKVLNIDSGTVSLFNNKVGMIFQDCTKQIIESTVIEEIKIGCVNYSSNESEIKFFANEMSEWAKLSNNKSTLEISASQTRLLEISANIFNREIIVFDEPTNGLDNKNFEKLVILIQNLLDLGRTILIISHDDKLAALCNRFILINDGAIVKDSTNFIEIEKIRQSLNYA
jgi:energy-coupling factor transport system ATP-binding protein